MPVLAYTDLAFLEANHLTKFIPISQFMLSLVHNLNSMLSCQHVLNHLEEDVAKSLRKFTDRDDKVAKLAKIRHVRKFIKCTEPTLDIPKGDRTARSTNPVTVSAPLPNPRNANSSTYPFDSRPNLSYSSTVRVVHMLLSRMSLGYSMDHQPFNITIRFEGL